MENENRPTRIPTLLFGLLIGLLLAGLIWLLVRNSSSNTNSVTPPTATLSLNLTSPKENLATSENTLTVKGTTGIDSVVTIIGPTETKILQTDGHNFSTIIHLTEGANLIDVTVYNPTTGDSRHTSREVLYLNEALSNL